MSIERFKSAQAQSHNGYDAAIRELRAGRKRGHWIWYIFPQIAGLGSSADSRHYGLRGMPEATTYLQDPLLREHLIECTCAVAEKISEGHSILSIMGSEIDVLKLVSSLTLFELTCEAMSPPLMADFARLAETCAQILAAAERQGFRRCASTLASQKRRP